MSGTNRARRTAVVVGVTVTHALVLLTWRPSAAPPRHASRDRMIVRSMAPANAERQVPVSDGVRPPVSIRGRAPTPPGPRGPRIESVAPVAAVPVAPVDAVGAETPQRPLDLTVRAMPPAAEPAAAAALADPRSNGRRSSLGELLAQRLGSDLRRDEEVRVDGSVRIRRGTSCLDAKASRGAELDPFHAAERPAPRQISRCD